MQIDHCDFPEDLLYDLDNNIWVKVLGQGMVKIGITSVHAALAGKLNTVKFKPAESALKKRQSVASIESIKYFGVVRTPLTGTLVSVNESLMTNPKLANDFPYTTGWFAEIDSKLDQGEMAALLKLESARDRIRAQVAELRVRCFSAFPDYEMWEIGVECAAVLVRLTELVNRIKLNEVVHVVSDDPTADIEMERWSDQTGQAVLESRSEGKLMHFVVKKVKE